MDLKFVKTCIDRATKREMTWIIVQLEIALDKFQGDMKNPENWATAEAECNAAHVHAVFLKDFLEQLSRGIEKGEL